MMAYAQGPNYYSKRKYTRFGTSLAHVYLTKSFVGSTRILAEVLLFFHFLRTISIASRQCQDRQITVTSESSAYLRNRTYTTFEARVLARQDRFAD